MEEEQIKGGGGGGRGTRCLQKKVMGKKGEGDDRHVLLPLLCARGVISVKYSCRTLKDGGVVSFEGEEEKGVNGEE